jgi:hypothetical protein
MPRVIINAVSPTRRTDELVRVLAQELTTPGDGPQPLIVERHLPAAHSRHVHVVWDKWGDLADEERSSVIVQAYARAEGEEAASNITVALGLRPEDAIIFGVLPFKIVPEHAHMSEFSPYRIAFGHEVEKTVLGVGARELRYASREAAEEALKRMKRHAPTTSWMILREDDEDS